MSPEGAALAKYIREQLNGGCNTKLDLCARLPCDDAERSVVALQDINAGELLLRIPVEGCLRGRGDAVATELAARLQLSDAYVATLPTNPPGLETWTPAERALLRGTRLENVSRGDADRAALLVRTRCVHVSEDQVAMVPGVDALNDASGRAAPGTTLKIGACFEMVAERDLSQGEEVTHRYDDVVDAADYLERYGFAPVVTTCSKVFAVEDIVEASQNAGRREVCSTVLAASQGRVCVTPQEPLPDDLLNAVLVCVLQDEEELEELMACTIEDHDEDGRDPAAWSNVDARGLLQQASDVERDLVAAGLARLADNALAAYVLSASAECDPSRVEAARRVRDSERSACIALRAALKDMAWLGAAPASRKRGRDEDPEGA
ncbi:unnamed protein product [Pelagomonas calceolata]|uniref:SET domain-containing protein n=2 Tax=Pelagomonas calceolata TaxID=35677 RepID=A0A8J2ST98_9STRA|nr:unnamed protein product [Pelagomonas calceolata]